MCLALPTPDGAGALACVTAARTKQEVDATGWLAREDRDLAPAKLASREALRCCVRLAGWLFTCSLPSSTAQSPEVVPREEVRCEERAQRLAGERRPECACCRRRPFEGQEYS